MNYIKYNLLKKIADLNNNPFIVSIRKGLTYMIPFMILGSFATFINNLPISAFQDFMSSFFGPGWTQYGALLYQGTFTILALTMSVTLAFSLTVNSKRANENNVTPIIASLVALSNIFVMLTPENGTFNTQWFGAMGLFFGLIITMISVSILSMLASIRTIRIKVFSNSADPAVTQSLGLIFPALFTISVFILIRLIFSSLGIADIYESFYSLLKLAFSGLSSSLLTALLFVTVSHIFWFVGIHGNNAMEIVVISLFVPALAVNADLVAQGLPPTEIFTKQFFDVFVFLGGSGATLCLIIALLLVAKQSNTKQIAKISLLPSLINVNELVIFGTPIIFNFYFIIPFIFLPGILTIISFLAMKIGLVPLTIHQVDWTTPIFWGGYIATGSLSGSLLQLANLIIGVLIYIPFVRLNERHSMRESTRPMKQLIEMITNVPDKRAGAVIEHIGEVGNLSRELAADLLQDLNKNRIKLEYQPIVSSSGHIIAIEALLRWNHKKQGLILPPVAVRLAEEGEFINQLGSWMLKRACGDFRRMINDGLKNVYLSVNVTPSQLSAAGYSDSFKRILTDSWIDPTSLMLEITEESALGNDNAIRDNLKAIKSFGVMLGMDDFGMGHSSLMYIKDLELSTIKLDGALVRELNINPSCKEIISSVIHLCNSLNISTVAEYTETADQIKEVFKLGCTAFQGYYFSSALPVENFMEYYKSFEQDITPDLLKLLDI